jgi:hypothetical protein
VIQTVPKRYQVALWETKQRTDTDARALFYFDTLEEARQELDRSRNERRFAAGILFEWHKDSLSWQLIEMF